MNATGKLWGLGVGPGDPDLITLKALKILQQADIIAYPAPVDGESFARSIAAPHLIGNQAEYAIRVPMVMERQPAQDAYDKAAEDLKFYLNQGKTIAVLCEGDPFLFGSFMYIYQRLVSKYHVGVIPGVSSIMACAAEAGMPLAERTDTIMVLPGSLSENELTKKIKSTDTAVIMKVGKNLSKIKAVINKINLDAYAVYAERVTLPEQRIIPFEELNEESAPYFSMVLIQKGKVKR
jgi:precorrin-2/cobalt-factor-2 C20-methyltransferase